MKLQTCRVHTSENVKEAVLFFFLDAKIIADTTLLELVARGSAMNEMKKVGMLVTSDVNNIYQGIYKYSCNSSS